MCAIVIVKRKVSRNRCTEQEFIQALVGSDTLLEVSKKTGQKLSTTIAKYKKLRHNNKNIPQFSEIKGDYDPKIVKVIKNLKKHYR